MFRCGEHVKAGPLPARKELDRWVNLLPQLAVDPDLRLDPGALAKAIINEPSQQRQDELIALMQKGIIPVGASAHQRWMMCLGCFRGWQNVR